jgi:FtsH-binding integral membrane protein
MGARRAMIVDDGVRAKIYGILRIPLNIFVVVALTTTTEGDAHRNMVFLCCAALLVLSSMVSIYILKEEYNADAASDKQK